jgi:hypothetical protein
MEIKHHGSNKLLDRKVVIYTHNFVDLKLDEASLKTAYFYKDKNKYEAFNLKDMEKHKDRFIPKIKPILKEKHIFIFDFHFLNAIFLHGIKLHMEKYGMAYWVFLSFFYDDETLIKKSKNAGAVIDGKIKLLDEMSDFPNIQKIEISEGEIITEKYLLELFDENFIQHATIYGPM